MRSRVPWGGFGLRRWMGLRTPKRPRSPRPKRVGRDSRWSLMVLGTAIAAFGLVSLYWLDLKARRDADRLERQLAERTYFDAAVAVAVAELEERSLTATASASMSMAVQQFEWALREAHKLEVLQQSSSSYSEYPDWRRWRDLRRQLSDTLVARRNLEQARDEFDEAKDLDTSAEAPGEADTRQRAAWERFSEAEKQYGHALKALRELRPEPVRRDPPSVRKTFFGFLQHAANMASPGLVVIGTLLALAPLFVWLFTYIGERLHQLLSAIAGRGNAPSLEPGSFGATTARVAAGTAVAALTLGAFAVAVPGESIRLALQRPELSDVAVRVGEFGIDIEGNDGLKLALGETVATPVAFDLGRLSLKAEEKTIPIKIATPSPLPEALVEVGALEVIVEGKRIEIPAQSVRVAHDGAGIDVAPFDVYPPPVEVKVDSKANSDLVTTLEELRRKLYMLEGTLQQVEKKMSTVEIAGKRLVEEAQVAINATNQRPMTALFHQDRIDENCDRFCSLSNVFDGQALCADPTRLKPFLFWKEGKWRRCERSEVQPATGFEVTTVARDSGLER